MGKLHSRCSAVELNFPDGGGSRNDHEGRDKIVTKGDAMIWSALALVAAALEDLLLGVTYEPKH